MPSQQHEEMVAGWVAMMSHPLADPTLALVYTEAFDYGAVPEARSYEARAERPAVDGVVVSDVDAGGVPSIWIRSADVPADTARRILYIHGGAYIVGSPDSEQYFQAIGSVSRQSGARCLAIRYRRAPESPFPAAVDDAVAAYRWLLAEGVAPEHIVIAGDSAGGGLVLCALVALRDAHLPLPAGGICVSPWTDLTISGPSAQRDDDPICNARLLKMWADVYLAGADPKTPTASPLFADLRGLPPLQVLVGGRESLLDDARRLVDQAKSADVDASLKVYDGVVHMWLVMDPRLPESQDAYRVMSEFVGRHAAV